MTISVGDSIPNCTLSVMGSEGPAPVSTGDLFSNNKILMFAVPGAFTPGCSLTHLPGYVANADKIKEKGIDGIICLSVNDVFVMHAWGPSKSSDFQEFHVFEASLGVLFYLFCFCILEPPVPT